MADLVRDSENSAPPGSGRNESRAVPALLIILMLALLGASSCAYATPERVETPRTVPALPPDTLPTAIYDDSLMVSEGEGGRWSVSMINLLFEREADQPYRQRAIDLVQGRVVGGVRLFGDGYYILEVPNDGRTLKGVDLAIGKLQSLPLVRSVFRVAPLRPVVVGAAPRTPI